MRKVKLETGEGNLVFIDDVPEKKDHKCDSPRWKFLSSQIIGDPLKSSNVWVVWECEICHMQATVQKTLTSLMRKESILKFQPQVTIDSAQSFS